MKKVVAFVAVSLALTMIITGCKKREEPASGPSAKAPMGQKQLPPHGPSGPKVERTVDVPDFVKGKWKKAVLVFEDKTAKKSTDYTVTLGSEFNIPNTKLKVVVGEFMPEFKMNESSYTSASNDPVNPALRVEVFENGSLIFSGWLYSKFPTMHPLEHQKYGLTLKEGVKG